MAERYKRFLPYWAYVIYNLLLTMIPICIMVTIFLRIMYYSTLNKEIGYQQNRMVAIQSTIDRSLEDFGTAVLYASMDSELRPYTLSQNNYSSIVALQRLKQHMSTQENIETFFYAYSDDCFYTPAGKINFYTFEKNYLFSAGWTFADFYQMLFSTDAYGFSPVNCYITKNAANTDMYVAMFYPWGNGYAKYGTAIGLIPMSYFANLINASEDDPLWILNQEWELFLDGSASSLSSNGALPSGGVHYVEHSSALTGWKYISAIPSAKIYTLMLQQHWVFLCCIAALALCFSLVGIGLATRYYMPIHGLQRILGFKAHEKHQVHDQVTHIMRYSEDIRLKQEETQEFLSQEILAQLIWNYSHGANCISQLSKYGISLEGPVFAVFTLYFGDAIEPHKLNDALKRLQRADFSATEANLPGCIALIYSGSGGSESLQTFAKKVCAVFPDEENLRIGVGGIANSLAELNRSFVEAVAVLKQNSSEHLCYFDELVETQFEQEEEHAIHMQCIRLAEIVRQGDSNEVPPACDLLENALETLMRSTDLSTYQYISNIMIHNLLPLFQEAELGNIHWKINLAIHALQPSALMAHVRALCMQAAQRLMQKREQLSNQKTGEILTYVDAHITDYGLSLGGVAELFHMSQTSLSRLFNEAVGMRFIDYVSSKRMAQAAALIAGTDAKIADIIASVGYVDASSFARKFMKSYGMSPTAYRKHASQQIEKEV